VGKPHLWNSEDATWSESDLCDFIEVFHDLAARPTRGWIHGFAGCGFHPTRYSRKSGQALYRWRVNALLETTTLELRLAEDGEDIGQMIRAPSVDGGRITHDAVESSFGEHALEVSHAVALFRSRTSSRSDQRSAIVALAGVLEQRRQLLASELLSKDEGALFEIANKFDLRHRNDNQRTDYDGAFLEWIFYWYLATVHLTNRILLQQHVERE